MNNKSYKSATKKRDILFKNFNDISFEDKKEEKDKYQKNSAFNPFKTSFIHQRIHLNKGQIPIFSTNNKIILLVENKYEKKFQKGKSPFFISDKLNFKTAFKYQEMKIDLKPKHLGLCDYYRKNKENKLMIGNETDSDDSKTPRFNKD